MSVSSPADAPPIRLTLTHWLILVIASIGFAFDTYELLVMPLIGRPALADLIPVDRYTASGAGQILGWFAAIMWGSALCGGTFGLLGGYLTDWLGRRRVLTWSIILYAVSALASGFATTAPMLLFFRCTTFIGVCVEFVAAVAWLAELFPNPRQREAVLGYTQAFSSVGGLLVTGAFWVANHYAEYFPAIYGGHASWRYTLISGVIPALPLLFIRPFLPESPAWQLKRARYLDAPAHRFALTAGLSAHDLGNSGPFRLWFRRGVWNLGVSSPQLDDPDRGFAYAQDAPLDMRMDRTKDRTAADIVNGYPAAELARVLRDYGEERFARRIAGAVVRERAATPIASTQRLSAIVKDAIPAATRRTGGNPAKRTFQALRIEVNDELGTLRRALPAALGVLAVGGRVVVLAYHSLEDRIVKRELVRLSTDPTPPRPARARTGVNRAVPPADQGRRAPGQRRSHRQSARGLRPAAGRGTDPGSRMTRGGTDMATTTPRTPHR